MSASDSVTAPPAQGRSAARLAAVQALYQIELSDAVLESVIEEFLDHRIGREIEGAQYAEADREHFKWLVRNVSDRLAELDGCVGGALGTG
ncbi:MAG: transcription antitermination factor NusB, partial [Alphaproteobacteria bacterium]|nr:transcription antitermination factor NusB [Alphaproteobacteria bacterium]